MTAPSPTARGTPSGISLKDGYQCLITFGANATLGIWEKELSPPGMDGGEKIDVTTMHNVDYKTFVPQALVTLTGNSVKAAYDPGAFSSIVQQVNREDTITFRFADGSTWAYYGYLRVFKPDNMQIGQFPMATIEIEVTNWDYVNKVEAGPAIASVTGT